MKTIEDLANQMDETYLRENSMISSQKTPVSLETWGKCTFTPSPGHSCEAEGCRQSTGKNICLPKNRKLRNDLTQKDKYGPFDDIRKEIILKNHELIISPRNSNGGKKTRKRKGRSSTKKHKKRTKYKKRATTKKDKKHKKYKKNPRTRKR